MMLLKALLYDRGSTNQGKIFIFPHCGYLLIHKLMSISNWRLIAIDNPP